MKDRKPTDAGDPEGRRPAKGGRRGGGPARPRGSAERGFVERATARGHSGHGAESVRPYLRDQLKLKSLLPTPFPTPEPDVPSKDDHHL